MPPLAPLPAARKTTTAGAQLDTWVYKSHLMNDGSQVVIDDYYYYERYGVARLSLTLRKHLGF
jgi:hypothetical protein